MFTYKTKLNNFLKVVKKISKAKLSSSTLRKTGEELKKVSRNCFLRERSPDGRAWEPLAKVTLKKRKQKTKILYLNGRLMNSVRYKIKGNSVVSYTPLKYGILHQVGCKEKNLPARPFIGISKDAKTRIKDMVIKALKKELK